MLARPQFNPQHLLYFFPEPHVHGSFRPTFTDLAPAAVGPPSWASRQPYNRCTRNRDQARRVVAQFVELMAHQFGLADRDAAHHSHSRERLGDISLVAVRYRRPTVWPRHRGRPESVRPQFPEHVAIAFVDIEDRLKLAAPEVAGDLVIPRHHRVGEPLHVGGIVEGSASYLGQRVNDCVWSTPARANWRCGRPTKRHSVASSHSPTPLEDNGVVGEYLG